MHNKDMFEITHHVGQELHQSLTNTLEYAVQLLNDYAWEAEERKWPAPVLLHPSGDGREYDLDTNTWK